ncbi:MAG: NFACT family protein [Clostridia bacterium]|nr:NFACT family protein [Clostridia bacterium]
MPADAVNYKFLAEELNAILSGGRIDKIVMSDKTSLMIFVRAKGETRNLLITASTSPRCYLSEKRISSTETPLSFCLHLRRHIGGGIIESVESQPFERILVFRITARGDLGEEYKRILIVEIMGKYSNVVVTDENFRITEALKHVPLDESRPIMPGIEYKFPNDEKPFPTDDNANEIFSLHKDCPATLVKHLKGMASSTAKEIIMLTSNTNFAKSAQEFLSLPINPVVYYDNEKPIDFSFRPYASKTEEYKVFPSISKAMDEYYLTLTANSSTDALSVYVKRVLTSSLEKQRKKLGAFIRDFENAKDYENERILGELITANLYKINRGDTYLIADNWYDGTEIKILLTESTPQEDASKHFKRYQKKKRTISSLETQIEQTNVAIDYLESIETALSLCQNEDDVREIENELEETGYLVKQKSKRKVVVSEPRKFDVDGFEVLIGKSNVQNDRITKEARGDDLWLHTQGFHGSHVIVKTRGKEVPYSTIIKVAGLTAFFSKARLSESVPVDYTKAKNVHKKRGAVPGKVDYFGAKTVYVKPTPPTNKD